MKSYFFKICLLLIIQSSIHEQLFSQFLLNGFVKERISNLGIDSAQIILNGKVVSLTDQSGLFLLYSNLNDTIYVNKPGYKVQMEIVDSEYMEIDLRLIRDVKEFLAQDYGTQDPNSNTSASVAIKSQQFNKGIITDAALLLQGKVAGLQIYNRGGDINRSSLMRIRGLNTFGLGQSEPLIIIDGIISASLQNLDPNDVENIEVIKDASGSAIYGIRGSAGVISITTKSSHSIGKGIKIDYKGQLGISSPVQHIKVMDAQSFRQAGGLDLGSNTNWMDEITQSKLSQTHSFSASGGLGQSKIRVSVNIRNINGIILNSHLGQQNARLNFTTKALSNKLSINFTSAITSRNQNFSFQEAIRYALLTNPTAPVYGKDAPFTFNSLQFGGYYEQLGLFDAFNPVSIIYQNKNLGKTIESTFGVNLAYQLTNNLSINAKIASQDSKFKGNQYFPTTAYYLGNANNPSRKGLVKFEENENMFKLYEIYASYIKQFGNYGFSIKSGYSYQIYNHFNQSFSLGDFPNNDLDYTNHIESSQDLQNAGYISGSTYASPDEKVIGVFAKMHFTLSDKFYFNATMRRDGSTKLGKNNNYNLFSSFGLGFHLHEYLHSKSLDLLRFRIGYGNTGGLPLASGLSNVKKIVINGFDGQVSTQIVHGANQGLKWENKTEKNIGIDFRYGKLSGSVEIYNKYISDVIQVHFSTPPIFMNTSSFNTKGIELSFNYNMIKNKKLSYDMGLVFSKYKTILKSYTYKEELRANPGAPGQGSTLMIKVKEGEELGQIWGRVFKGVGTNGDALFEDINGDGKLVVDQSQALDPNADFKVLGNGIPDFEIGWSHQIKYKTWSLDAFLRGAFGHSLINTWRLFYEPRLTTQVSYNFVNTSLAVNDLKTARFSSLYVEKADFLKLDNVTLSKSVPLANSNSISSILISLTGQNLFKITNYTGADPEPALQYYQDIGIGGTQYKSTSDLLSPGIDSRGDFLPSKAIVLGILCTFK